MHNQQFPLPFKCSIFFLSTFRLHTKGKDRHASPTYETGLLNGNDACMNGYISELNKVLKYSYKLHAVKKS